MVRMEPALVLAALTFIVGLALGAWVIRGKIKALRLSQQRRFVTPGRNPLAEDRRRMQEMALERDLFGDEDPELREESAWRPHGP